MSLIDLQTGQLQNVAQDITQLQALGAHAADWLRLAALGSPTAMRAVSRNCRP